MKRLLLITLLFALVVPVGLTQESPIRVYHYKNYRNGKTGSMYSYAIADPYASRLLDTLLAQTNKSRGANGLHRFRRHRIEGIKHSVTIHLDEGILTRTSDSTSSFQYFYNAARMAEKPNHLEPHQEFVSQLMFSFNNRISHHNAIDSKAKHEAVMRYIAALLEE